MCEGQSCGDGGKAKVGVKVGKTHEGFDLIYCYEGQDDCSHHL